MRPQNSGGGRAKEEEESKRRAASDDTKQATRGSKRGAACPSSLAAAIPRSMRWLYKNSMMRRIRQQRMSAPSGNEIFMSPKMWKNGVSSSSSPFWIRHSGRVPSSEKPDEKVVITTSVEGGHARRSLETMDMVCARYVW